MGPAIADRYKRFDERTNWDLALRVHPALGHYGALRIHDNVGDVGIRELARQQGSRGLIVKICLRHTRVSCGMPETHQQDNDHGADSLLYCVQRYVTVCWILSF